MVGEARSKLDVGGFQAFTARDVLRIISCTALILLLTIRNIYATIQHLQLASIASEHLDSRQTQADAVGH